MKTKMTPATNSDKINPQSGVVFMGFAALLVLMGVVVTNPGGGDGKQPAAEAPVNAQVLY